MDLDVLHLHFQNLKKLVEEGHVPVLEEIKDRFNKLVPVFGEVEDRLVAMEKKSAMHEAQIASLLKVQQVKGSDDAEKAPAPKAKSKDNHRHVEDDKAKRDETKAADEAKEEEEKAE